MALDHPSVARPSNPRSPSGLHTEVASRRSAEADITQSINRDYVAFKEVERPKFRPGQIVKMMRDDGYPRLSMHSHTELWRALDAKAPGKNLGVSIAGSWFWYATWIDPVKEHCAENAGLYQ